MSRRADTSPETLLRICIDLTWKPEVRELAPGLYSVQSKSQPDRRHRVDLTGPKPRCTHEFFKAGQMCSHIQAAIATRDAAVLVDAGPEPFDAPDAPQPVYTQRCRVEFHHEPAPVAPRVPEPFHPGDRVTHTNERDGSQTHGTIERIAIIGGEEQAVVKFYSERLGKWDRAYYSLASLTPRIEAPRAGRQAA